MMKIDTKTPMPKDLHKGRKRIYPFAEMKVGDSLCFDEFHAYNRARMAAAAHGRRTKTAFCSQQVSETEMRVWRIK